MSSKKSVNKINEARALIATNKTHNLQKAYKLLSKCSDSEAKFLIGTMCENYPDLYGGVDRAIEWYKKAQVKNDHANAFYNHGTALVGREEYLDAIPLFHSALKIEPNHKQAMNNLAVCYELLELKDLDTGVNKSYDFFKRLIELDPEHSYAHHNLGHINAGWGDIETAQKHLEIAYKLNKDYPETCYTLGVIYNGFTLNSPHIEDPLVLFDRAQKLFIQQNNLELLYLQNKEPINKYEFADCTVSAGYYMQGNTMIISHHSWHIPIQRWWVNRKNTQQLQVAWSALQHNSWGFYHWVCETFPRVLYIIDNEPDPTVPILVPDKSFARESLASIDRNFIYCSNTDTYQIGLLKLIDWQTVTKYDVLSKEFLPPDFIIHSLRAFLQLQEPPANKIIWLSRTHKKGERNTSNEDTVIEALQQFTDYEIIKFIPENYNYQQTQQTFASAKIVIGVHGGAFSNIVYAKHTNVIEFSMYEPYYKYYFEHLSDCCGHNYYRIPLEIPNLFRKTFDIPQDKIDTLINIVSKIIS